MMKGLSIKVLVVLVVLGAVHAAWFGTTTRSVTTRLTPTNYEMTYAMAWGLGMKERLTLMQVGDSKSSTSTDWIEVSDKPYNSGAVVYARDDGQDYLIGINYDIYRFLPGRALSRLSCDRESFLELTAFAKQLVGLRSKGQRADDIDPGARRRFEVLQPGDASGSIATNPPSSRYYFGLRYLGRFGLAAVSGSSEREIRFVPAESSPEPRLALHEACP
ncbi:hypothetical protein SR870_07085 [Rhodopseudomonas palustris]|uniref:hypothetical protein n=1 Tax=Rhodopseudomonas palustris TaxID=1076 RepID=UPI002ACD3BB0|nr:hypothetical protein [Rhodopseudomonas palustris]WQH01032.1 hypothetical protein SR870_07085 [Rhodopseudomonas palustris]